MTGRSELQIVTRFRSRARIRCPEVSVVGIPNAAKRGQRAMNQARREGAAWGFPDVMCLWPGGGVAFIEFKREQGGRLSLNQMEWIQRLTAMGHRAIVSSDPDHALEFLRQCGAPVLFATKAEKAPPYRPLKKRAA